MRHLLAQFGPCSVLALISAVLGAGAATGQDVERYSFSEPVMGTEFRVVIYADDGDRARLAADLAFARARELDSLLSDWRSDSALRRLSRFAGVDACVPVARDLLVVLEHARDLSEASGGAFDVTVGPLSRLWRWAMRRGELPSDSALAVARAAVGYQKLVIDSAHSCVRLVSPRMQLDLGGIAKGYAADEMLKSLISMGLPSSLVDAGGDIAAGDSPPGSSAWTVPEKQPGQRPTQSTRWPDLRIVKAAVATSGDRYRFLESDGVRYSHLLDPGTGIGLTQRRQVTVVAPSGIEADALASAISVMGRNGLRLADRPGYGARLTELSGGVTHVSGVGILKN